MTIVSSIHYAVLSHQFKCEASSIHETTVVQIITATPPQFSMEEKD